MDSFVPLWVLCISAILIFTVPNNFKHTISLALVAITIAFTSYWAGLALFYGFELQGLSPFSMISGDSPIVVDKLSAFFILVVNFTVLTGLLYAKGYLKSYLKTKNKHLMSIHYFSYVWLYFSMLLVTMVRGGLDFLIVWELMTISSFLLVIFDSEKEDILKTGINYLIQMHVGFLFLLVGFLFTGEFSGTISFDSMGVAFSSNELFEVFGSHGNFWLFLIFFIGFGIKAGFIPLHAWLPHAHPAAPSHVSGVMSGVMIKMGIYGILRVLTHLQSDWMEVGVFILIISILSGLYGVMMAIVQHDLKKLLAYHSIENIGIIGIGIGLGLIGIATENHPLAVLGFGGGILHILNHSLFKSLLFYGAGSVYKSTHTRELNSLGGLIKSMPKTAIFFLLGALAICGLPPFNGFVSEFLIYSGLFKSLSSANLNMSLMFLGGITSLALIGGLAIFCFTKAFGVVFLGSARCEFPIKPVEADGSMLFSKLLVAVVIVMIGVLPNLFLQPISEVVGMFVTSGGDVFAKTMHTTSQVGIISGIFILVIVVLYFMRKKQQSTVAVEYGPTWGCGYTGADPAVHQYTATSYADNYKQLTKPVVGSETEYKSFSEEEIFAPARSFVSHSHDKIEDNIINKGIAWILKTMERFAVLHTGKVQHYLIYPLVFILTLFLLTLLNII
ncbi:MAG: proton-conducting transporter membrane subunit [Cyclobacteriaceae bacterium]|nr:proton-conducting transporter membrane subunit [Cyclobacteriaceae bacterium]